MSYVREALRSAGEYTWDFVKDVGEFALVGTVILGGLVGAVALMGGGLAVIGIGAVEAFGAGHLVEGALWALGGLASFIGGVAVAEGLDAVVGPIG